MVQVTFGRMLETFLKFMSYSWISIVVLILIIGLAFVFYTTNNTNKKQSRNLYIIMYLVIMIAVVVMNFENLYKFSDYILDHFFVALYFPNVVIYGFVILATNIITLRSVFNSRAEKGLRLLNVVAFSIINYLLILSLMAIADNSIDIFNEVAVYENADLLSLVQLSMSVFAIWMLLLMTYYGLKKIHSASVRPALVETPTVNHIQHPVVHETPTIPNNYKLKEGKNWKEVIPPLNVLKKQEEWKEVEPPVKALQRKITNKVENGITADDKFTQDEYRVILEILKKVNKQ